MNKWLHFGHSILSPFQCSVYDQKKMTHKEKNNWCIRFEYTVPRKWIIFPFISINYLRICIQLALLKAFVKIIRCFPLFLFQSSKSDKMKLPCKMRNAKRWRCRCCIPDQLCQIKTRSAEQKILCIGVCECVLFQALQNVAFFTTLVD